ncbi:MAG: ATP-binding cassette domain-containing protein [Gemmatales bacterium]|nr:ATP-binding cassette domain-containing protein [Gemmatales bacterium]MDW8386488.1 ATP-binding cassette domain-containing protein [Gemmatales bacterium]
MSMIQVRDLTKYYGSVLAVDHVSFSVDKGEVVGFLGPNGAGKTTTMRILTTYIPATSGTAKVAGFDVMKESLQVRQNLGYLPENVPLYPEMRVEEYLTYRAKLKGVDRRVRKKRIEYCMERCRILGVRRRLVGTLSRGYRQRVGLAEAMVHDPPILIMDEPTAGLDPNQQIETLGLIRELGEKHTILLSTHILPEVEEVCRRVIVINQGRVALEGRLADLQRDSVIVLEVKGPQDRVKQVLQETDGVDAVEVVRLDPRDNPDGIAAFELRTRDNRDLRLAIAERIVKQGWIPRRLDLRRKSLREHFMRVTMGSIR